MKDHMTATLAELKSQILADGVVDADEAAQLRERLFDDGVIDRDEATFLFELNDAVSGQSNDPAWQTLFVDAISSYVLEDDASPGVVDDEEAAWLVAHIQSDGQIDAIERALLERIVAQAKSVPDSLRGLL
jgi:uncharacterized membrane protein YebE (DUF533 family)